MRAGVHVVIGGRPNAGKSTLLNALVGRDRAIVSPTPGTTRDEIEAEAELSGLSFRFVDTAGLRETADAIEAEGVRRTHAAIERSDLLLYVYDATCGLDDEERDWLHSFTVKPVDGQFTERSGAKHQESDSSALPVLLVGNKADLLGAVPASPAVDLPTVALSALRAASADTELEPVRRWLVNTVLADLADPEATPIVVNERHRQHFAASLDAVRRARAALDAGGSGDTLALDLRVALHELGAVTGAITNEDVLGTIFSRFCIGK